MLTFAKLVISYTVILTIMLILFSTRHRETGELNNIITIGKSRNNIRVAVALLTISLFLYVGPHLYLLISSVYTYPNPDTYGVIISVLKKYNWNEAPIDQYYKSFPIYLIEVVTLHILTELNAHYSLVIVHTIAAICMLIFVFLIGIKNTSKIFSSISLPLYTLTIVNSVYLYSYVGVPIPQFFALYVLLLLITMFKRIMLNNGGSDKATFIMISILSLVHFGVTPIFGLVVISFILISIMTYILLEKRNKIDINVKRRIISHFFKGKGMSTMIIVTVPILLHTIYVFSSCDVTKIKQIKQYIDYYVELLNRYVLNFESSIRALQYNSGLTSGINRPLSYINAFAPASFISIALYGFYATMRRRNTSLHINLMLSHFVLGILLLSIGFIKMYIDVGVIPGGSITRYVNVYGFILLAVFNVFVLCMILNSNNELLKKAVITILIIGFVGVLTDPFAIQYRPSLEEAECVKSFATLLNAYNIKELYFTSRQNHYYLGPLLSLWTSILSNESATILYKIYNSDINNIAIKYSLVFNSEIVAYMSIVKSFNEPMVLISK